MWFSILSDVHVIVDYSIGSWMFNFYTVLFVSNLFAFYFLYVLNKGRFIHLGSIWKGANFITLPIGYGLFLAWVVFGGIPKLIHNFSSNEGSIELTVERKINYEYRGRCTPRIEAEEVTFFMNSYICVPSSVFDALSKGDKVMGYGKVSIFGVEINDVR